MSIRKLVKIVVSYGEMSIRKLAKIVVSYGEMSSMKISENFCALWRNENKRIR